MNFEESGNPDTMTILAFALVIFSVVASSIGQNVEIHLRTKDLLPLKIRFDFSFIKNLLSKNRKYGFSYFFSSFHTLLVLMFLGRFYPTASGFKYAGIWALALSLIEILLIVPSSLGNSLLHKIPHYSPENKNERAFAKYGNPGEKYGYPAFLILDKRGNILSIRKTEDMEEGKGYNKTKVKKFLQGRLD